MWSQVDTIHLAFQEICNGRRPWTALGNFLNYWWSPTYAEGRRQELIAEPLPEAPDDEYCQRWAAYCAASVECLCRRYNEPCPSWVHDPRFVLATPWYNWPGKSVPAWFIRETPKEFKKRNIYTSSEDQLFESKYEFVERHRDAIEKWKEAERQKRILRARKIIRERLRQRRKALAAQVESDRKSIESGGTMTLS